MWTVITNKRSARPVTATFWSIIYIFRQITRHFLKPHLSALLRWLRQFACRFIRIIIKHCLPLLINYLILILTGCYRQSVKVRLSIFRLTNFIGLLVIGLFTKPNLKNQWKISRQLPLPATQRAALVGRKSNGINVQVLWDNLLIMISLLCWCSKDKSFVEVYIWHLKTSEDIWRRWTKLHHFSNQKASGLRSQHSQTFFQLKHARTKGTQHSSCSDMNLHKQTASASTPGWVSTRGHPTRHPDDNVLFVAVLGLVHTTRFLKSQQMLHAWDTPRITF